MVIDQGTMLDRIDYNVERMGEEVKGAEKELKVATNYQRRSVKRKILLFLIICIVGMVILLSLKLGSRGGKSREVNNAPANGAANPPVGNAQKQGGDPGNAAPFSDMRRLVVKYEEPKRRRKDWRKRRRRSLTALRWLV